MESEEHLSASVVSIAEQLARWARGYDNHLKWNEKAKFKADLMNARHRWRSVDPAAFAAKLRAEGMRREDIDELVDWLRKAQAGKRLVPDRGYRTHIFGPPPETADPDVGVPSRDW